ncbi:MAG: glycosyltransferase family 4 protein [Bacteroidota bacterium]
MHVLHIFNEINFSGAEIMYANAAPMFQAKGIQMTAVNTGDKLGNFASEFDKADIKIIHRPLSLGYKNPVFLFRYFRAVYAYIKKENVDVVHVHRSDVFWYYSLSAALAGKKTIMTPHNVFKNRKITWLKAYLERLSARKILKTTFQTIGESVYNNELIYYKNPSVRINNWYDAKRFYPPCINEKKELREKLGIEQDDFVVISTGSCSAVKNHAAIIDAMALLPPQHSCIYLHLGTGQLETTEIRKAAELNVSDKVKFLGNKVNVRDYLIAADVYIMPSKFEGLSIAAIEAMACKLPSILYNSPGLTDLIKNDNNGFLIDPEPAQIAEKIILFKKNPDIAAEKGNNAFHFVQSSFSIENGVNGITELYSK